MRKTKHVLLAVTSVVMAFLLAFAVGCNCKKKNKDEEKTLQSIELDTSDVKKDYIAEQDEFTAEGLKIKATYLTVSDKTVTEDLTPTSEGIRIDSSEFEQNKNVAGVYNIVVYYTYLRQFKTDSYTVNVIIGRSGLDVTLKDGQSNEITAVTGGTDISAAANWINVRRPDIFGNINDTSAPLNPSQYTVTIYKDAEEVQDLTKVGLGAYQIWASMTDDDDNLIEGFAIIYVVDTLVGIEFKSGTTQQTVGEDEMTETWKFTATFETGETIELSKSDVTINGVDTFTQTNNGTATVSYVYRGVEKTTTVTYQTANPTGTVVYKATIASDGTKLASEWDGFTGLKTHFDIESTANSFKQSAKATEDGRNFVDLVEIKSNKTITLKFGNDVVAGSINITVYVSHNNTSSKRTAQINKTGSADKDDSASLIIDTTTTGVKAPYVLSFGLTGRSAGNYVIDATDTMNMYAIEITYTVKYGN